MARQHRGSQVVEGITDVHVVDEGLVGAERHVAGILAGPSPCHGMSPKSNVIDTLWCHVDLVVASPPPHSAAVRCSPGSPASFWFSHASSLSSAGLDTVGAAGGLA